MAQSVISLVSGRPKLVTVNAETVGSFTVANNISSASNVTGLLFSGAAIRSAHIRYESYRKTASGELAESGTLVILYNDIAADWDLAVLGVNGNAGVTFTITSSGQVQYVSTNLAGTSYVGTLKFSYITFDV